ncbi:MAG: PilZ domain-containing protein [Candidatus Omnitrophota bacterium]
MKERRSRIGLSVSGEATYKISGSAFPPVDVIVSEISKSGLKFITSNIINPETLIELTIKITSISEPIQAVAQVLWQRKLSSRFLLDTSAKFIKINEGNSKRLVKYIYEYAASSVISREYVRCSLITEVNFFDFNDKDIKGTCLSTDIGVKGMKLLVEDMIDVGRELMLTFNLPDDNLQFFKLKGKVVWVRKGANNVLGVRFEKLSEIDLNRIIRYVEAKLS